MFKTSYSGTRLSSTSVEYSTLHAYKVIRMANSSMWECMLFSWKPHHLGVWKVFNAPKCSSQTMQERYFVRQKILKKKKRYFAGENAPERDNLIFHAAVWTVSSCEAS